MSRKLLDTFLERTRKGDIRAYASDARNWFSDRIEDARGETKAEFYNGGRYTRSFRGLRIGKMYAFVYDPKTKKKLPYYDRLPLVIPIEMYNDGFLGINLHYLDPRTRAILLDKLMVLANRTDLTVGTKLKVTYSILNSTTKYKEFRPTVKRYLQSHVRSSYIRFHAQEWYRAIFLPFERFSKASKRTVWADSKRKIRGR